jgi:hypothetical protein
MTDEKSPPKRTKSQHYVPRLHLRRFIGEQPKNMIWTYDSERGTARPSVVEETGAQRNFYSVQAADGTFNDDLDIWLRGVEGDAMEAYEQLLAGSIPRGQARANFATFVASLYARSPALIRASAIGKAQFMQHFVDLHWGDRGRFEAFMDRFEAETGADPIDRDRLHAFWGDKEKFTIAISQKQGLPVLAASNEIADILYARNWYLVEAVQGFFVTSDSPVFRFSPPQSRHAFYGDGGFKNPAAEITVPLSPRHLLLITGQEYASPRFWIAHDNVWDLNRARAIGADRFLYASVRDDRVARMAAEHRDTPERYRLHGAGPFAEVKVTR